MSHQNGFEEIDYGDLSLIQIPVRIGGGAYVLQEADEAAAVAYQNAATKAARFNEDGNLTGVDGAADVEPLLVSRCLFDRSPAGGVGSPVPLDTIKKWPARIVSKLFEKAKEISQLDTAETVEKLEKQIARSQARLVKLKAEAAKGKGESPAVTTST